MNCNKAESLLERMEDGELSPAPQSRVLEHVELCASCRTALADLRAARSALRSSASVATPPALVDAILSAVDEAARADSQANDERFRVAVAQAQQHTLTDRRPQAFATHAAAALLGLAASFAIYLTGAFRWFSFTPAADPAVGLAEAEAPSVGIPMVWEGESVALSRAGERSTLEAGQAIQLLPGDRLNSGSVELAFDAADSSLRVVVEEPAAAPEPFRTPATAFVPVQLTQIVPPAVVQTRAPHVSIEFAPLTRLASAFGSGLERWANESRGELLALLEPLAERALVAPTPAPEPSATGRGATQDRVRPRTLPLADARRGVDRPSLTLRRNGDRISLETRGPLPDVVSILISKIEHDDPEMSALVLRRLESIRASIESASPETSPARGSSEPGDDRRPILRWLGRKQPDPDPSADSIEHWRAWRDANHELLAAVETSSRAAPRAR